MSYVSHRAGGGSVKDDGAEEEKEEEVTFQFPAVVSPPSQFCCRVFLILLLGVCWAVPHRERQSTSAAAAMGPNMAPAQLWANTTEYTHTHIHTHAPKKTKNKNKTHTCPWMSQHCCCDVAPKSLFHTRNSLFMHTGLQKIYIFRNTVFTRLDKAGKESHYFNKKSLPLKCP